MRKSALQKMGISLVAVVGALGIAAGVAAKPGHGDRGFERLERKLEKLELAEDTKAAVSAVLEEARPVQKALHEQVREEGKALRGMLDADSPDEAAILEQADAVGELKTELHKQRLRTWLQVRALLSREQRETLAEMRRDHGRRGERHGERHGR